MAKDMTKVPQIAAGKFDVLYINRAGRDVQAEVIARGTTGGFNTVSDSVETPEMTDLVVDLSRPLDRGNGVRVRIPDACKLIGWGGDAGIDYRFRVLD